MVCTVYILHIGFQNRNRLAQSDGFIGEWCGEYFLWRQHENDITFSFGYYYLVTFSLYVIFLTEDCCKAWNFKYQNLVFLFLSCVIILLFSPIYMVIEHSFMNCSYTAKIYIYILLFWKMWFCLSLSVILVEFIKVSIIGTF